MTIRSLMAFAALPTAVFLAACSPKYNWRDYASPDAAYRVLFPAKPASFTRDVDLDGMHVTMTMTAAEIDGATFAVGSAQAPDAAHAQAAVEAMQQALLRNIGAKSELQAASASATSAGSSRTSSDVDATGTANGQPMRLAGHFESRGKRFYQVIVMGKPQAMPQDQVDQFLTSFKPQ
ncbi:MAG TPA: hypothetical protein VF793_16100 [Telluria sp.]|jgi:hypothetical protein